MQKCTSYPSTPTHGRTNGLSREFSIRTLDRDSVRAAAASLVPRSAGAAPRGAPQVRWAWLRELEDSSGVRTVKVAAAGREGRARAAGAWPPSRLGS